MGTETIFSNGLFESVVCYVTSVQVVFPLYPHCEGLFYSLGLCSTRSSLLSEPWLFSLSLVCWSLASSWSREATLEEVEEVLLECRRSPHRVYYRQCRKHVCSHFGVIIFCVTFLVNQCKCKLCQCICVHKGLWHIDNPLQDFTRSCRVQVWLLDWGV